MSAPDLTAQRFGRLIVERAENGKDRPRWRCVCDCGTERVVEGQKLRTGQTQSCDLSIDRIEVNDDYRPGNCRWATASLQAQNRRYGTKRKLTATHVERIRAVGGVLSSHEIVQRFGVTHHHINSIIARRSWREASAADDVGASSP
jgi:hypothetical protein